jgi:ankyrin repeat protein
MRGGALKTFLLHHSKNPTSERLFNCSSVSLHATDTLISSKMLLESKADANASAADGWNPLQCAAQMGHNAMIELLIKGGADVSAGPPDGFSALFWAAQGGFVSTVQLLLDNGADPCAQTLDGTTPVMLAASRMHTDVLRTLLAPRHGGSTALVSVDTPATGGVTPLMVTSGGGAVSALKCLLEHRANVNAVASDGLTALQRALQGGHFVCAEILLDSGASRALLKMEDIPPWVSSYEPGSRAACRHTALCVLGVRQLRSNPLLNSIDRHLVLQIARLIWSMRRGVSLDSLPRDANATCLGLAVDFSPMHEPYY